MVPIIKSTICGEIYITHNITCILNVYVAYCMFYMASKALTFSFSV